MFDVNNMLCELMAAHGQDVRIDDDWLVFAKGGPPMRGVVYHTGEQENVLQMDVQLALPDGRVLTESCAGMGRDAEDAFSHAVSTFTSATMHLLLAVFYGVDDPLQDVAGWDLTGPAWTAYPSHFTFKTFGEGANDSQPPVEIPPDLWDNVRDALTIMQPDGNLHWLSVFYVQAEGKSIDTQILWEGKRWPLAEKMIAALPWPVREEFYSVRGFLVLKRDGRVEEGRDARTLEQGLALLLDHCTHQGEAGNDDLLEMLIQRGFLPDVARRLLSFGPTAFSQLILGKVSLPTHYVLVDDDGASLDTRALAHEPVMTVGSQYAHRAFTNEARREGAMNFAMRCPYMNAINQAMNGGADVSAKDLELSPLTVPLSAFGVDQLAELPTAPTPLPEA